MVNTNKEKKSENNREAPKTKGFSKKNSMNNKNSGSSKLDLKVSEIPLPSSPRRDRGRHDQSRYVPLTGHAHSSEDRNFSEECPAYLVIEAVNKEVNLNEISMVKRNRELNSFCGKPKRVSRASKKAMQIDCIDGLQSRKLLTMKTFVGTQVTVTPHRFLNESKGVVSNFELINCTENEIQEDTAPFGVTYVKRLFKKVDSTFVPSSSVVLTFNTPHPPSNITIGWVDLQVRPYKELPRRCRNCQRFGHGRNNCKQQQVCPRCSGPHNNDNFTCSNQPLCSNCGGPHGAYASTCPKYRFEAEVLSVRSSQKLSFPDARALVEASGKFPAVSYAQRLTNGSGQSTAGGSSNQAAAPSELASTRNFTSKQHRGSNSKRPRESDDDSSPNHNINRPLAKYRNSINHTQGLAQDIRINTTKNSNLITVATTSNSSNNGGVQTHTLNNPLQKLPREKGRSRSLSRHRRNSTTLNNSNSSHQQ